MSELENFGIKKVIVIDDNYLSEDFNISEFLETDIANISRQIEDYTEDIDLQEFFEKNPKATLGNFFESNHLETEDKKEIIEILEEFKGTIDRYKVLKDDIGEGKIISFNPKIEEDLREFEVELDKESVCTFIVIDKILDVTSESKSQQLLKKVLLKINEAVKKNKLLFMVLYSTDAPKSIKNYEAVKELLVQITGLEQDSIEYNSLLNSEFPLHINFVDKGTSQEKILENFTIALRRSQKAAFTSLFNVSFTESMNKMRERVWELGENESLFYYNYLNEGQHVDNIIFDIFDANFKNYYNYEKDKNYQDIINPLRKSTQIFSKWQELNKPQSRINYSQRLRLINKFYYLFKHEQKLLTVSKSDDISFGDVINISGEEYLVVSQDCDTTIRQEEGRKLDDITLLKLKKSSVSLPEKLYKTLDSQKTSGLSCSDFFNEVFLKGENLEGKKCLEMLGIDLEKAQKFADEKKGSKAQFIELCSGSLIENIQISIDSEAKVPNIYSMKSFWLDVLLLRSEGLMYGDDSSKTVIVTKDSICSSKEIRYATQKKLLKEFDEELAKFLGLEKNMIQKILSTQIFSDLLDIKPFFDSDGVTMIGFEIENYSRVGHKDNLSTMELHNIALVSQTRIARNSEMLF